MSEIDKIPVLLIDDDWRQLERLKERIERVRDFMADRWGRVEARGISISTYRSPADLEKELATGRESGATLPYRVVISDVYMTASGDPTEALSWQEGGRRVYDALKAHGFGEQGLLVFITNRDNEASQFYGDVAREQAHLEAPWVQFATKPSCADGRESDEAWEALAFETIMRAGESEWRRKISRGLLEFAGMAPGFLQMKRHVQQLATQSLRDPSPVPLLCLAGESGCGKTAIARLYHDIRSAQGAQGKPRSEFVQLNVNAGDAQLAENELWGWEKGGFTGADQGNIGHCERARGGTLFLDEFGTDIDRAVLLAPKLLKLMTEGLYQKLNGKAESRFEGALALGSSSLEEIRACKRILPDFFRRVPPESWILIPPLRDRRDDIPVIAQQMLARQNTSLGIRGPNFTPDGLERLRTVQWSWPGNCHTLFHFVRDRVLNAHDDIDAEMVDAFVAANSQEGLRRESLQLQPQPMPRLRPRVRPTDDDILRMAGRVKSRECSNRAAWTDLGIGKSTWYASLKRLGLS